jgi:hypothetical protein
MLQSISSRGMGMLQELKIVRVTKIMKAKKMLRCEKRVGGVWNVLGSIIYVHFNNVFNLRRLQTILVLRGLRMLLFWTPRVVILSKYRLVHMICQYFHRRLVLIVMKVR